MVGPWGPGEQDVVFGDDTWAKVAVGSVLFVTYLGCGSTGTMGLTTNIITRRLHGIDLHTDQLEWLKKGHVSLYVSSMESLRLKDNFQTRSTSVLAASRS